MKPWQVWAKELGKKLLDAGNIALGALIFGQLVSGRPFSLRLAIGGVIAWLILAILSFLVVLLSGVKDERD